jgi:hypothetical protein
MCTGSLLSPVHTNFHHPLTEGTDVADDVHVTFTNATAVAPESLWFARPAKTTNNGLSGYPCAARCAA